VLCKGRDVQERHTYVSEAEYRKMMMMDDIRMNKGKREGGRSERGRSYRDHDDEAALGMQCVGADFVQRREESQSNQTFCARRRGVMRTRDWRAPGFVSGPPAE